MSDEHLTTRVPFDDLPDRLDALGALLVEAEHIGGRPPVPAPDGAFLAAAERRAQFNTARRWMPRMALAAAASVAIVGGYLVYRTSPAPAPRGLPSDIAANESSPPTLGNLRTLNRDVTSPEQLRLTAGGTTATVRGAETQPAISPSDARTADRIDAIISGK